MIRSKSLIIYGTRPELIKMIPIIKEFERRSLSHQMILVQSGQHTELLEEDLRYFNVKPAFKLLLERESNTLSDLVAKLLFNFVELFKKLEEQNIEINSIIAQGDTATTYASALHAFHQNIPFYHIEAGMRTFDIGQPFPEEFYRQSISAIADFHFAPTPKERDNLIIEKVSPKKIRVTGNTVIDILQEQNIGGKRIPKKQILITLHRRSLSPDLQNKYIRYFESLIKQNLDWEFLWIRHPGLKLNQAIFQECQNLRFIPPVSYSEMILLYKHTNLMYTDSGGIQEEATYLGIPCVVARTKTERSQGIKQGIAKYIDFDQLNIHHQLEEFDANKLVFKNPLYGTGNSAKIITDNILDLILGNKKNDFTSKQIHGKK